MTADGDSELYLVDTSLWIEAFRHEPSVQFTDFVDLDDVVTCLPVVQEVLQGFGDERAFRLAHEAMFALPNVESPLTQDVYEHAIDLYRTARRKGLTIRSSVDCLIAACAIRNNLTVLHKDRDFPFLAQASSLKQRQLG